MHFHRGGCAQAGLQNIANIQPFGSILGTVQLPADVARQAANLAGEFFAAAEGNEFSGDAVETCAIPLWARRGDATWLPDLDMLGYRRAERGYRGRDELLVLTAGVDMHTDDEGLVLMVVLHNDGLTFRQGKIRNKAKAGNWFIFDDRLPHGLVEANGRATSVGWNIPIVLT